MPKKKKSLKPKNRRSVVDRISTLTSPKTETNKTSNTLTSTSMADKPTLSKTSKRSKTQVVITINKQPEIKNQIVMKKKKHEQKNTKQDKKIILSEMESPQLISINKKTL